MEIILRRDLDYETRGMVLGMEQTRIKTTPEARFVYSCIKCILFFFSSSSRLFFSSKIEPVIMMGVSRHATVHVQFLFPYSSNLTFSHDFLKNIFYSNFFFFQCLD